jgi:G:T-mismatch repair DNA endonuclease (very short patch repair protein)
VKAKTNATFWEEKITSNRRRDRRKREQLERAGWIVETFWECQVHDDARLAALIQRLLAR